MEGITNKHPELNTSFARYRMQYLKSDKGMPLDYVMVLPKKITRKISRNAKQRMLRNQKEII